MRYDVVVIGGGPAGFSAAMEALREGRSCAMLSEGKSLEKLDYNAFTLAGGMLLMGDRATGAAVRDGEIVSLSTSRLGNDALTADKYILASGRFFSGGLRADMDSVFEPVFGLDLDFPEDRSLWFDFDFFAPQPFMDSGVTTDAEGHPSIGGVTIKNLFVKGDILTKEARNAEE